MSDDELFSLAAPLVVERLGRSLGGVPPGTLRVSYLAERLQRAPALPLVRALACAQREAVRGSAEARLVIETFSLVVEGGHVDATIRAALVTGAQMVGEVAVVPLVDQAAANDAPGERGGRAKKGSLAAKGETLGRRKWLARSAKGDLLLRILDDPHPHVVENALMNPRVTEALAVRVAARRPVPPEVLDVVGESRFASRAAVRRALVLNPDCPPKLAVRLLSSMTADELADVVAAPGLCDEVHNAAELLLRR
ncbi:MAG: hypothetical protein HYS27_20150 [Deltaproteobacteria bacterium]|nr:hypothetical protein [Deltaproteobacteria bacterium]